MSVNVTDSADIAPKEVARISNSSLSGMGNSIRKLSRSEIPKPGKQAPVLHGNDLHHN